MEALIMAIFIVALLFGTLAILIPGALWEKQELGKLIGSRLTDDDISFDIIVKDIEIANSLFDENDIESFLIMDIYGGKPS